MLPFLLLLAISFSSAAFGAGLKKAMIVYGEKAAPAEISAANDLARDISRVYGFTPKVVSNKEWKKNGENAKSKDTAVFYVGTPDSHSEIKQFANRKILSVSAKNPGAEAFVIQSDPKNRVVIIAGCDARGVLYGSYEYSARYMGIDPYEYWTGKAPAKRASLVIPEIAFRENPPVFPLRGYFDNDNDMLANWKGKKLTVEFDTWKEMIDSLARLRYNYIDLHDTLGRAEFWNWKYYTEKFPGYHTDLELINKIIDYAHSKGMLVQVPMYLGWEFYHLPYEKICLSRYNEDWMQVYRYYLEKTPLGKADMFLQRPRDPWWDKGYKCKEEEENGTPAGPLLQNMFNGLVGIVNKDRPGGKVICDLWAEGRQMWAQNSFNPDPSIDMLWADNGYAVYDVWPSDFKGHKFGIYVHAGYFLNHVMQDPYPDRIKNVSMEAARRGMTHNYFVNGQDFKHFILNIEACAMAAWSPEKFDPDAFYLEWTGRYFGKKAAPKIVESLKALHAAHEKAGGYAFITGNTVKTLEMLKFASTEDIDLNSINAAYIEAELSVSLAQDAAALVPPESRLVYDDQILFPATIYLENLKLYRAVASTSKYSFDSKDKSLSKEARKEAKLQSAQFAKETVPTLDKLRALLDRGSEWEKWDGWTKVENFRKITPPPDIEDTKRIMKMFN